MLSAGARVLAAKTDCAENRPLWLPLWMHARDTVGITECLLDEFVSDALADNAGLSRDELVTVARFIAFNHDTGKICASFASSICGGHGELLGRLEHYGIILPERRWFMNARSTPHALAGEVIVRYYGCNATVAAVIGAHHGVPTQNAEVVEQALDAPPRDAVCIENYIYKPEYREIWEGIWSEWMNESRTVTGIDDISSLPVLTPAAQMLLTGLLIMADWLASNTRLFPLIPYGETGNEADYPQRIDAAWKKLALPYKWEPMNDCCSSSQFKQCFGFLPNAVQKELFTEAQSGSRAGLFILEAPMGCGKTEAALSAAEVLATRYGKTGIFFGLPTQATANGIFGRVASWGMTQAAEEFRSIRLAHGSSMLNEAFSSICSEAQAMYDEDSGGGLMVHSWFSGRKQSCLADFVVGTVDQLLMSALKRKHVMLLHLGLSQKVAIIDECHAYDTYMNQYLERALQWLGMYNVPVILLSATLPAQRRAALVRAYQKKPALECEIDKTEAYPLLTWTDGDRIHQQAISYDGEHRRVRIGAVREDNIAVEISKCTSRGGCVGVIVNTVTRAQRFAETLKSSPDAEVIIYHAQFIMPDRAEKEKLILSRAGKSSSPADRDNLIIVGTQVLEQSLDIDFDLLITDLCPMDLLLQRIGRLHRHNGRIRPQGFEEAQCLVIGLDDDNPEEGSMHIYGEWLLRMTKKTLPQTILLPDDISPLVQAVYKADDTTAPEYAEAYRKDADLKKLKESRAKDFLLSSPKKKGDIHGLLNRGVSDANAEASVRDGISSVEVLVMRIQGGKCSFLPWHNGGAEVSISSCPDEAAAKKIAGQRLRLPSVLCTEWNIEQTIKAVEEQCRAYVGAWQQSHLLNGAQVLFLDERLSCEINGYILSYNRDTGLTYERLTIKSQ